MNADSQKRPFQFSLFAALAAMLIIGVGGGSYVGKSIRKRMRDEAAEKQFLKLQGKLEKQRSATHDRFVLEQSRISADQRPNHVNSQVGGGGQSMTPKREASWNTRLKVSLGANVLADVTASANLKDDKFSVITIKSAAGIEDAQIIERMKEHYDQQGWDYIVIDTAQSPNSNDTTSVRTIEN